jgi:hypothetical protein
LLYFIHYILVDIRDFFEPNGSSKLAGILEQALNNISNTSSSDSENQSVNYKLLECIIALARTVAKSERNKSKFPISIFPFIVLI